MWSNLYIFPFVICGFDVIFKDHWKSSVKSFLLCFLLSVLVLALTFKIFDPFKIYFCVWHKIWIITSFFCMWDNSFSGTTVEKTTLSPLNNFDILIKSQLNIYSEIHVWALFSFCLVLRQYHIGFGDLFWFPLLWSQEVTLHLCSSFSRLFQWSWWCNGCGPAPTSELELKS